MSSENPSFLIEQFEQSLARYPDIFVSRDKLGEVLIVKEVDTNTELFIKLFPSRDVPGQLRLGLTIAVQEMKYNDQRMLAGRGEYTHVKLIPINGVVDKVTSDPHPSYSDTLIIETALQGLEIFDAYSQIPKSELFFEMASDKDYDERVSSEELYSSELLPVRRGLGEGLREMGISPVQFYPSKDEEYKSALILLQRYGARSRNEISEEQIQQEIGQDSTVVQALMGIISQSEREREAAKVAERRKVLSEEHEKALRGLVQRVWGVNLNQVSEDPLYIPNRFRSTFEQPLLLDDGPLDQETVNSLKGRDDLLWELTDKGFVTYKVVGEELCEMRISAEGLAVLGLELVESSK